MRHGRDSKLGDPQIPWKWFSLLGHDWIFFRATNSEAYSQYPSCKFIHVASHIWTTVNDMDTRLALSYINRQLCPSRSKTTQKFENQAVHIVLPLCPFQNSLQRTFCWASSASQVDHSGSSCLAISKGGNPLWTCDAMDFPVLMPQLWMSSSARCCGSDWS